MPDASAKPQRQPARIVSGAAIDEDLRIEASVRPKRLDEYIGQKRVKENIQIAIEAARSRDEALDLVRLYGPPGLGKTTLAQSIANELNVPIKTSAGPLLERKGDLTAILTSLEGKEVFFLDEIHRLQPAVEEVLYPAMEDFRVDLIIGQGPGARIHPFQLGHFTLIGATTRGANYGAVALAFRHCAPAGFLRTCGFADHHSPLGKNSKHPDGRRRRRRNRESLPRHTAHREPLAAARARFCGSARGGPHHPRGCAGSIANAGRRPERPGRSGPQPDDRATRQVRRRAGRRGHAGGRPERRRRRHRRDVRALPHADRIDRPHPPGPSGHAARLRIFRPRPAEAPAAIVLRKDIMRKETTSLAEKNETANQRGHIGGCQNRKAALQAAFTPRRSSLDRTP